MAKLRDQITTKVIREATNEERFRSIQAREERYDSGGRILVDGQYCYVTWQSDDEEWFRLQNE